MKTIYGSVLQYSPLDGGGFAQFLEFQVQPNSDYDIQTSANGKDWQTAGPLHTQPGQKTFSATIQFPNGVAFRLVAK